MRVMLLACVLASQICFAQFPTWLENDSLSFRFGHIVSNIDLQHKLFTPDKYVIRMVLNSDKMAFLASLTCKEWGLLLENPKTDYHTSLILYALTEKDALLLHAVIKDYESWLTTQKEEDVSMWKKYLKKHQADLKMKLLEQEK